MPNARHLKHTLGLFLMCFFGSCFLGATGHCQSPEALAEPTGATALNFDLSDKAPFRLQSDWVSGSENAMSETNASAVLPILLPFSGMPTEGSPPPLVKVGFGFTDLVSPDDFYLPSSLYEYTMSLTLIRPINERWTVIAILGAGMATDNENRSSDAWQFRGGILGVNKWNDHWSWTLGVIGTGRRDIPVVPAVGAVWEPNSVTRVDLTFPRPRLYRLIRQNGEIYHWAYLGASINGTTWAYENSEIGDDQLTYRDWRLALGWEVQRGRNPDMSFGMGKKIGGEFGLAFAREYEFEHEARTEVLENSIFLSINTSF